MTPIPELGFSGSWVVTSPDGSRVLELYEYRNVELCAQANWKIETAAQYLGRINAQIRVRDQVANQTHHGSDTEVPQAPEVQSDAQANRRLRGMSSTLRSEAASRA